MPVAIRRVRSLLNKLAYERFAEHVSAFREILANVDSGEFGTVVDLIGRHAVIARGDFIVLYASFIKELSQDCPDLSAAVLERVDLELRLGLESDSEEDNVRFFNIVELIAALCRNGVVPTQTVKTFIENAFRHGTPTALEAVYRMLNVMRAEHEKMFSSCFDQLAYSWTPRFSNRLRFLILDLIELRGRLWLPRRPPAIPGMMKRTDFRRLLQQHTG
uniref:MIF4G domain-containing protein n=1 Tax=Spongospora subterranea TaxID=70186 RepID=A0A0H5RK36_9EUKA|eukprot:CRZ09089.1 hypothetical protein [Spongospora subterranea]